MTIEELVEKDPEFSESGFISKVDNTYIMLLSAIMMWDIEMVNHKISDNLYEIYKKKIEILQSNKERQMYDELNVRYTNIQSISETDTEFIIKVLLVSNYMDYIIDADTGKYKSGINDHRIETYNNLTFTKKKASKDLQAVKECPNCGASVDINKSGICEFCHTTFNLEDYDWILTMIS